MNTRTELKRIGEWLNDGNTGLSSMSMCAVFLGGNIRIVHHPHDPSDFDRCVKFSKHIEKRHWNKLISKLARIDDNWKALKDNWTELMELYNEECVGEYWSAPKLYKKMNEIY